jgi:hypothetical protein
VASIKRRGGAIRVQFRPEERMVLTRLASELAELLEPDVAAGGDEVDPLVALTGIGGTDAQAPDDPALRRLLPDAYDDAEGAAEFRRLTDDELRRGKIATLTQLVADVESAHGTLELTPEQVDGWVRAVNDIRLVLGVRIGIDDDDGSWRDRLAPDDPRLALAAAYDWLSMIQELLLDALL